MSKTRALQMLSEQARRARDDAAAAAAGAHRNAERAQQTLDMLSNYLGEHLRRGSTTTAFDPALLRVRDRFTSKLDAAIGEQSLERDRLEQAAEAQREALIARQQRLLAFETLSARRAAAQRTAQHRADQRLTDELAAQASRRAPKGVSNDS
ncbi:MAG TPA: flagellar export protein FliJ [Burkholderiaceae bacterium]|nr:flagellar export protein FliJ [Burkholderiaceae bacterium]